MDLLTKQERSWNMGRIRSKNTAPEKKLRSFLHKLGFRFRMHVNSLPGRPDIVLPKYKTIIDVRGCFWHRHQNCKYATIPSSNIDFWSRKFDSNVARDIKLSSQITALGWRQIIVWECELKMPGFMESIPDKIILNSFCNR